MFAAMGGRCFEWALVGNAFGQVAMARALARPQSWRLLRGPFEEVVGQWAETLLPSQDSQEQAEADGEEKGDFHLQFSDGFFLHCRLEKELKDQGWSCLLREIDPALPQWLDLPPFEFEEVRRVVVREVPPTFIVTCSLSPIEPEVYKAIFTTLGGQTMAESYIESQDPVTLELGSVPAIAAARQGRLQSQNQKVCVMLEGKAEPLGVRFAPKSAWL